MKSGPCRVDGIILRPIQLGDSSKIVSALTAEYGRVKLVARGSRKLDSKLGSLLEPGNEVELVLYPRLDRELWTLSDASLRRAILTGPQSLSKLSHLFAALELIDRLLPEREAVPEFEELSRSFLDAWHGGSDAEMSGLFFAFELAWLDRAGLGLEVQCCASCGNNLLDRDHMRWSAADAAFLCPSCGPGEGRWIESSLSAVLTRLSKSSPEGAELEHWSLTAEERSEVGRLLHEHMSMHLHGYRLPQSLYWIAPER